jgi:hypothetical protein
MRQTLFQDRVDVVRAFALRTAEIRICVVGRECDHFHHVQVMIFKAVSDKLRHVNCFFLRQFQNFKDAIFDPTRCEISIEKAMDGVIYRVPVFTYRITKQYSFVSLWLLASNPIE